MSSFHRLLAAMLVSLSAAACGGSPPPPPVSTTTTSSAVAVLSGQGLVLRVESDGATVVLDREGRTQASILVFETAFATELRAEFPQLDRHYVARLVPGTKPNEIVEKWIASGVISQGAVRLADLERFTKEKGIELRATPEPKTAADERFVARACDRCLEDFRACDAGRAAERQYARAGVTLAERSCEAALRACGQRANPEARRRKPALQEWPCGHPKP
jgi:hypothetical protein